MENQLKILDFYDFQRFVGNLGVYLIPRKLCAGLFLTIGAMASACLSAMDARWDVADDCVRVAAPSHEYSCSASRSWI